MNLYETDFYAWSNQQAALLRAGEPATADIGHIAEEIESVGKTEKRELVSRLSVLLMHLLTWRFQPDRRSASWEATVRNQRRALTRHLRDNPSLKAKLDEAIEDAYGDARIDAYGEIGLNEDTFPQICPWSFEMIMNETFWPD